jgi:hypothetical protein
MRCTPALALLVLAHSALAFALPRVLPPRGAVVVRQHSARKVRPFPHWPASLTGRARQGEFATIGAAVAALPADNSTQVVFVYPGTYAEQVNVTRGGHTTVRCSCCTPPRAAG